MNKSTLCYQINTRILILSIFVLLIAGITSLWQARQAVEQEMNSSVNLAKQLITIQFSQPSTGTTWIHQLQAIKETRHLRIELKSPNGQVLESSELMNKKRLLNDPPEWFSNLILMKNNSFIVEQPIIINENQQLTLTIEANPINEISEVWNEYITFFGMLSLLIGLIFITVQILFNHVIKSIDLIVKRLATIEEQDYQTLLPEFSNYEMNFLAQAINNLILKLNVSQKENLSLIQHTLTIQEEERQRLSQELHDELGQSLTAIKIMSATIAKADKIKNPLVFRSSQSIIEICDKLISVVRSMMQQLHPLILNELGLKEALYDLVDNWKTRSQTLHIDVEYDDTLIINIKNIEIHLFRIVQEGLTNIFRHANASYAKIKLWSQEGKLLLEIEDNGIGCTHEDMNNGFGLLSMKDRVRSLNGEFKTYSSPNNGLRILVIFSYNR